MEPTLTPPSVRPTAVQSLQKLRDRTRRAEERVAISEGAKMKGTFAGDVARAVRALDRLEKQWPATQDKPGNLGLARDTLVRLLMGDQ